jgi:3-hydroxyisobutyrate dehydrogenase
MRLGFAGLGLMGAPMAANLLRAGFDLAVYNRSAPPREALRALGARAFSDAGGLFAACDTVVLMLADDRATDQVLGRGSVDFAPRVAGKLIVNMGTHALDWSKSLEDEILKVGGRFVEAPVSGSRGPAEAGQLVAMVAGEAEDVDAVRPLLAPLCREVVETGQVPMAMACKMAVNLFLIASVAALAEAAALATRLELDLSIFEQVIGRGPLGSDVARAKLSKMTSGDFAPQAAIRDVCKNAALVAEAAAAAGLDAALLGVARKRFEDVLRSGRADLDMAAVVLASDEEGAAA